MSSISVRILLFAGLAEQHGSRTLELSMPEGSTLGELRSRLKSETFGGMNLAEGLLDVSRLAVGQEFQEDDYSLPADSEVAIIPPVSGG
ncbi:MAG: MoaD/ThiS family protein [Planctomycetota bacterium]